MDTFVSIAIYLPRGSETAAPKHDLENVWQEMAALDSLLSNYRDDNLVARINAQAAIHPVALPPWMLGLFKTALRITAASGGAFDITIGSLTNLWGFGRSPKVPAKREISHALQSVGTHFLHLDSVGSTISLENQGTTVDLGGIAKGAIIDAVYTRLRAMGYTDFLIDAGGDLRMAAGSLTRGRRYVWIVHPRRDDAFFARFRLDSGAVATTGDYERRFTQDGVVYHHVLDPSTGYPARNAISATVIAPDATTADALATACFVLGPRAGIALAERFPDVDALIIRQEGDRFRVACTAKLKKRIEFLQSVADN